MNLYSPGQKSNCGVLMSFDEFLMSFNFDEVFRMQLRYKCPHISHFKNKESSIYNKHDMLITKACLWWSKKSLLDPQKKNTFFP